MIKVQQNWQQFADDTLNSSVWNKLRKVSDAWTQKLSWQYVNISLGNGSHQWVKQWSSCSLGFTCVSRIEWVNTTRPRQKGHHFAADIFKHNFNLWKFVYFLLNFTEICSHGSNLQYDSTGLNDLSVLKPLSEPNDALVYWRMYALLGHDEINVNFLSTGSYMILTRIYYQVNISNI